MSEPIDDGPLRAGDSDAPLDRELSIDCSILAAGLPTLFWRRRRVAASGG